MKINKWAFTLIELLVVVLIIGILAAVAVPQYQKAVEKSKATQALAMLKSVVQSAEVYYLANGTYPTKFEQLDLDIPWNGTLRYNTNSIKDTLSNEDWSLQISKGLWYEIWIGRISGPYTGGGFMYAFEPEYKDYDYSNPTYRILCTEKINQGIPFTKNPGDYCKKLFNGTRGYTGTYRAYSLQ